MTSVAWVSCRELPEPDPDETLTIEALSAAGVPTEKIAWDDMAAADASRFTLLILRSCWNYYEAPETFLEWIDGVAATSRLLNGPEVVHWNLHKTYLGDLEDDGVPIIPTADFQRGSRVSLDALLTERDWDGVVIKPAIGASSFGTRRFSSDETEAGQAYLSQWLAERDMLVQVFVPSVETIGEKSLVWIDGEFTHAVIKEPRFAEDDEKVSEAVDVFEDEERVAERAIRVAAARCGLTPDDLLYARVDIVQIGDRPVVSELELLEPSLFLRQYPLALERFVNAVKARAG